LPLQMRAAVQLAVGQALIGVQTDYLLGVVMERPPAELERMRYLSDPAHLPIVQKVAAADGAPIPSAGQQSVPAWLIFALFFTVIPLATTFVIEREQGSLLRLRVLDVSGAVLFASKLAPYYLVNLVQTALMLLVGVYLVPALGGDRLALGDSAGGLFLIASATSFAAIAMALLVAVNVRSVLQATAAGGTLCLLLGALGGIMVPKLIMPAGMQSLTAVSPMAWALEGYWDVLLRGGGAGAVLPECAALGGFALICLSLASVCHRVRNH
jgi:ABC-2 type transport system permease protein